MVIFRYKKIISLLLVVIIIFTIALTISLQKNTQKQKSKAAAGSYYDTLFPYGAFDPGSPINNPTEMTNYINNVTTRGMDSIMFNNTFFSSPGVQQMFTVADQRNFNIFAGPQGEIYTQWWNTNPTLTLDNAKQIAAPLVEIGKAHPSIKGYNLLDDADGQPLQKRNLMMQAFKELDPDRITSYINGTDSDRYDFQTTTPLPKAVYTYSYPVTSSQSPCVFNRGDLGQRDWVDNHRIMRQFIPVDVPIWQILQTHQTQKNKDGTTIEADGLRYPTVEELRLQQWLAIGENAKGIFWFTYSNLTDQVLTHPSWTGWNNNPAYLTEITDLSLRIQPLRPLLASLEKIDDKFTVTGTGKTYSSTFKHKTNNSIFLLVVNHECTTQTLNISSNYLNGQLKNLEDNSTQNLNTPISLRGGDGVIFEIINGTLVTPQPTPTTVINLVTNPGFEILDGTGKPTNWTAPSTAIDTTISHSGTNSLKVAGPTTELYYWNKPTLKANTKYMISAWMKTDNATRVGPDYILENPTVSAAYATSRVGGTRDWTKKYSIFTTPPNFISGRLDLRFTIPSGGTAWIDDVEVCEINLSCNPIKYTALDPFTVLTPIPTMTPTPTTIISPTLTPSPSPTPNSTLINSPVTGVTYQNTNWSGSELTAFMTKLSDTVITHHAKKNVQLPELQGMIYEWMKINPDRAWEDYGWDTMHDGAWFGNALASAYRATTNSHFLTLLNTYPLTFYPKILNNSDQYFVLNLPKDVAVVNSISNIPRPTNYPSNPVSKGIPNYLYDDGESKTFDGTKTYIGYRTEKYTSLHMQMDIATMLGATGILTNRDDVKLALKNLALGNPSAYADESGGHPSDLTKLYAKKLNPNDTELTTKFGALPSVAPSGSFTDPNNPPFGKTIGYNSLYLNIPVTYGNHLDGPVWEYYQWLLDRDRKPLDNVFAKKITATAYSNIVIDRLWYDTRDRQPGLNNFDGSLTTVSEKFTKYYSEDQNHVKGSRYGNQVMFFAATGLQLLKAFPESWTKYRDTCCSADLPVEIRWNSPTLDGDLDSSGYSTPITLSTGVTARIASSIDTQYLFIERPTGTQISFTIYSKADGITPGGTFTIDSTGIITAKGKNGTDDLQLTKAIKSSGGKDTIEISIPYTVMKSQKPWTNAVDDSRLSIKGGNGQLRTLYFLSSIDTVKLILEKEVKEGLRFWEFILNDWKMIPAGFYPLDGKNGLWSGNKSPDGFSDTGGYAGIINAAAAYKEYLDGNYNWELYSTMRATSPSTTPTQKVGDFNIDSIIDILDFNLWRNEFLEIFTTKKSDANSDSIIDLLDFNIWMNAFRTQ